MNPLNEVRNACSFVEGVWICTENGDGCRHGHDVATGCLFKCNKYCTCSRAMADAYGLLKQIHEQVIVAGTDNNQPMSVKILRHIADMHEAGIVADDAKVVEEFEEWIKSGDPVEAADYFITCISSATREPWMYDAADFPAAIAKNERRLAWMRQHQDPTKTPVELWKMAKVALGEVKA